MKTDTFTILKYSFACSVLFSLIGSFMKIYHIVGGNFLIGIGLLAVLIYVVTSLIEIFNSRRINTSEKLMWLVGFLFLSFLAGILYIFVSRKRIVAA